MKVFWELNGPILFAASGKHPVSKVHSGACSSLHRASISGSPFQKSAWTFTLTFRSLTRS